MSRIGKQPITIPSGVQVTLADGRVAVKGPKGNLEQAIHPKATVTIDGDQVTVTVAQPDIKSQSALWGLTQRLIANMVTGVTTGFSKQLEINGVGYRAAAAGQTLNLNLGYSHPIAFAIPAGITVTVEKNVVTVSGIDKQLVGQVAANIRSLRAPEPYKGKGIKYIDEQIRRKAGKTAAKAGS